MTATALGDFPGDCSGIGTWPERVAAGAASRFRFAGLGVPAADGCPRSETGLSGLATVVPMFAVASVTQIVVGRLSIRA
jgi:hypothetical protein